VKITKLSFLVFAASLLGQSQLFAQATWVGAGTLEAPVLWSDSLNWTGTAPVDNSSTSLTFGNTAANSFPNNDRVNLTVSSLNCLSSIRDNTVSGNPIKLIGSVSSSTGAWQFWNVGVTLQGTQIFDITNGRFHMNGIISDGDPIGGITKSGTNGRLVLGGDNSYTGGTSISGGSVEITHANALGTSGTISFGGGTLLYGTGVNVDLSSRFSTAASQTYRIDTAANNVTWASALSSTGGSLVKSGTGSLTLDGDNTYSGVTTLNAGKIIATSATAFGDSHPTTATNITFNTPSGVANAVALELRTPDGTLWNIYNLNMGSNRFYTIVLDKSGDAGSAGYRFGTLQLGSSTMTFNKGGNISEGASVNIGTLDLSSGNNERPVILNGDADISLGSATINSTALAKRLQLDGTSANNTVSGNITDGVSFARVSLIKANSSIWRLSGSNSYTGNTSVEAGKLILDQPSLRDITVVSITAGAVLELNHTETDIVNGLTLNGTAQPAGIYDKNHISGAITGDGKLQVLPTAFHIASTNDTLWSNTATWQGGPPVSGGTSDFTFIALNNRTSTNDLTNVTASSINIPAGGRDNTLNGTNVLTLAGDVTVGTGNFQTINMPLAISGDRTLAIQTGRLTLGGLLSGSPTDGIIKTGGGALYITGTSNTFSGDVSISGGQVVLAAPFLADGSTVTIDGGALDLPHGRQDTVNKLFIGGVEQAPGIYKSTTNTGDGTAISQITGTGTLNVLTGLVTDAFASWAQQKITAIDPAADATSAGDPDGDGATNLSEFAFNGNPLSGSDNGTARQFTADSEDGGTDEELILTIALRETIPAAPAFSGSPLSLTVAGVTYTIEGSLDLTNFNAAVKEVAPITTGLPDLSGNPEYEYRSFSLDASNGLRGKGFLRAKVAN
jgi:autotransporter-associated beta strand protein